MQAAANRRAGLVFHWVKKENEKNLAAMEAQIRKTPAASNFDGNSLLDSRGVDSGIF